LSSLSLQTTAENATTLRSDKMRRQISKYALILAFMIPGMTIFFVFYLLPIFQSMYFSFYKWNGLGPLKDFIAFDNYTRLLSHPIFHGAVQHSFLLLSASLSIQLPLALALALLLGRGKQRSKAVYRMLLFIPFVFSEIITAVIWRYVLHPDQGLLNTVLGTLGLPSVSLLGDLKLVLVGIFLVITWKYFGFHMILYMSGLQAIPPDLEEAARVDGANEMTVLRYITLPLLGNTLRMSVFLSVLGSLQQFVLIWTLTEGGPVNSSEVIGTYLYKYSLQRFSLGYGSAVAVVLFISTLVFSLFYQRFVMSQDYLSNYVQGS
jgi:raffinose/stachyose/melibiose transport system permease protein